MQQRRLRLGDILDDYCPRERRVTNHVVVAMIEDEVKQTRCSTCDADHEYKEARVPSPRRKKPGGVLSADVADDGSRVRVIEPSSPAPAEDDESLPMELAAPVDPVVHATAEEEEPASVADLDDDGPVHRPLIRATFPRPEGQTPERREPDFTIRQGNRGGREIDGNRPQGPKRHRRPNRGGSRSGDVRFGNSSPGNSNQRGGGPGNRGGHSPHGPSGGNQPGGNRDGRPGEGRFRRRRGR